MALILGHFFNQNLIEIPTHLTTMPDFSRLGKIDFAGGSNLQYFQQSLHFVFEAYLIVQAPCLAYMKE